MTLIREERVTNTLHYLNSTVRQNGCYNVQVEIQRDASPGTADRYALISSNSGRTITTSQQVQLVPRQRAMRQEKKVRVET